MQSEKKKSVSSWQPLACNLVWNPWTPSIHGAQVTTKDIRVEDVSDCVCVAIGTHMASWIVESFCKFRNS